MSLSKLWLVALLMMLAPGVLAAPPKTGLVGEPATLAERLERFSLSIHGNVRVRASALSNFDLDRGLTPSGLALFPLPISDPTRQTLTHADMRARLDLSIEEPEGSGAFVRLSLLDGLSLGSVPAGAATEASRQLSPSDALEVIHAYARVVTPIGLILAGRTPSHFGLGIASNGGDSEDADHSDSADRVLFATPLLDHVFTLAYDFGSGPSTLSGSSGRLDADPSDDTRTVTIAAVKLRSDRSRERRARAGKATWDYGLALSHRFQDRAYPVSEASGGAPVRSQVIERGYRAYAGDAWIRFTRRRLRVEAEAVVAGATFAQASLIPGVLLRDPVTALQAGAALETEFDLDPVRLGLDVGFASGDSAPGFGARVELTTLPARPGDLDGGQVGPPDDLSADNFRFHPEYRIDRILFREIIGRITDAAYLRPRVSVRILEVGNGTLSASLSGVLSMALFGSSTPSGESPLGVELDPTISWINRDGFRLTFEHAVLFPLAGLDNPAEALTARPAQLFRGRLIYAF
ncbi:MAG: hypothetical protein HYV07_18665 [Deltaproteobacteria bacterium]|nr:hypothetical protein [Deltaproteobacteria bacterium]